MDLNKVITQYKELLFCEGEPKEKHLQLILLIHSVNLVAGFKCTGLNEDDPESDYVLPPSWKIHQDGVYSFRYLNPKNKETIYFKMVHEDPILDVNAVRSTKTGKIYSISYNLRTQQLDDTAIESLVKKYKSDMIDDLNDEKQKQLADESSRGRSPLEVDPNPFWWIRPRNDNPQPSGNPFGDDGSSDLRPVPIDPFSTMPERQGNILGPGGPVSTGGPTYGRGMGLGGQKPGIRFDPYGPDDIDPFAGEKGFKKGGPGNNDPFGGPGGFGGSGLGGGGMGGFWGKPF